eukprot:367738-Pelagomonas_calceolata.AAC.2
MTGHWQPERKWRAKAIHVITFWERASKASGPYEAYCMFLVVEGALAPVLQSTYPSMCEACIWNLKASLSLGSTLDWEWGIFQRKIQASSQTS